MHSYELTYFNIKGRAESARFLFALAGQKYVDKRVTGEEWAELKPSTAFGQLPLLKVDGTVISQSHAILRFLANEFGYAGKTDLDKAKVDMIVDHIKDIMNKVIALFSVQDEAKEELTKTLSEETLPTEYAKLEKLVGGSGFFVGNSITFADVELINAAEFTAALGVKLPDDKTPKLVTLKKKVVETPKIKAWIAERPESSM